MWFRLELSFVYTIAIMGYGAAPNLFKSDRILRAVLGRIFRPCIRSSTVAAGILASQRFQRCGLRVVRILSRQ